MFFLHFFLPLKEISSFEVTQLMVNDLLREWNLRDKIAQLEEAISVARGPENVCSSLEKCPTCYVDGHIPEKEQNASLRESFKRFKKKLYPKKIL